MSGETPRCPFCSAAVESVEEREGWWARPCGHALGRRSYEELRAQIAASRPPWRFDVPEVPAHVTALKDVEGYVWVRVAECWQAADDPTTEFDTFHGLVRFVEMTPLVECPDPRAAL